jgi:hypothetical protein
MGFSKMWISLLVQAIRLLANNQILAAAMPTLVALREQDLWGWVTVLMPPVQFERNIYVLHIR